MSQVFQFHHTLHWNGDVVEAVEPDDGDNADADAEEDIVDDVPVDPSAKTDDGHAQYNHLASSDIFMCCPW